LSIQEWYSLPAIASFNVNKVNTSKAFAQQILRTLELFFPPKSLSQWLAGDTVYQQHLEVSSFIQKIYNYIMRRNIAEGCTTKFFNAKINGVV
jgi:hypothetical protein